MLKQLHPNVKVRLFVVFFKSMSSMMVIPFIAMYFSGQLGARVTGFLVACVILMGIVGGVLGGFVGDRIGRRPIMLWAECITTIGYIAIAFCNSPWASLPYITFTIFLFVVFFEGMMMPAESALILDSSTSKSRRFIFQIQYWCGNLATAIGSMIGGFMFKSHHFILFLVVAMMTFIAFLATWLFITDNFKSEPSEPESKVVSSSSKKVTGSFLKNYAFIIKDRVFLYFLLASIAVSLIETQLTNYIGVRMGKEITSQELIPGLFNVDGFRMLSLLQTENTILVVLGAFLIGKLVKKMNSSAAIVFGVFIFTFGYSYLMYGNSPLLLIIMIFIATIGELIYVPVSQAYLGDIAPDNARSSYMAINGLTGNFSMIIAGMMITLGALTSSITMAIIISIIGIFSAFCFLRSGLMLNKQQKDRNEKGLGA